MSTNNTSNTDLTQMTVTTLLLRQKPAGLKSSQYLLLLVMSNFYQANRDIEVGTDELAEASNMTTRSTISHLKALEELGYITKKRVGLGKVNKYRFDLEAMGINTHTLKNRTRERHLYAVAS